VAAQLGTVHRQFIVRPDAATDLPALAAVFGEPFADSSALPTHYLARETRGYVKVALSGDGGDELFGGYDRYRALALTEALVGVWPQALKALARMASVVPGVHGKSRGARLKRLLASVHEPPARRYASYVRLFDQSLMAELLRPGFEAADSGAKLESLFELGLRARSLVPNALALDRIGYLPEDLLTKVDRASMLHALEVRSPFMDHELVEFAAGLTTHQLLRGGAKRMLREAFAGDLPAWVFKRKKMGFAVPIGDWFRGELRPMLRDHLFAADSFASGHFNLQVVQRLVDEHEQNRVDHSQRLYALLMLELWWRIEKT
jgi:asparagine synthase (glutamine-hydrolysing)